MAGRPIKRPVDLVFISTTSLYGQRPNQYDRIVLPGHVWAGDGEVRFAFLGRTQGKGTYQFNAETMKAMGRMLSQTRRGQRVHHVFGEGSNPRLRQLRDGLDELGLSAEEFLLHGNPRLVYAMSLIENLSGYLLGMDKRPKWIVRQQSYNGDSIVTKAICEFWYQRWVRRRVENEEAMERLREHTLIYPVKHGARVVLPRPLTEQMEMF